MRGMAQCEAMRHGAAVYSGEQIAHLHRLQLGGLKEATEGGARVAPRIELQPLRVDPIRLLGILYGRRKWRS